MCVKTMSDKKIMENKKHLPIPNCFVGKPPNGSAFSDFPPKLCRVR